MVISSEQACQRGWKGAIIQQCPKTQALCQGWTVCWTPASSLIFSATLAATSSSFSTLDWLISPFLGGVKESRFTRSPALSCGETHIKITLDRFTRLDLRDSQIGNTWLAFSGREASLLVPQGGPEALLPLQGGSRDRQGGPVRHLYDQRF